MTRYWLTQHWQHPANAADDVPWHIYMQHPHRKKGEQISAGDKVVFYETVHGKAHCRP